MLRFIPESLMGPFWSLISLEDQLVFHARQGMHPPAVDGPDYEKMVKVIEVLKSKLVEFDLPMSAIAAERAIQSFQQSKKKVPERFLPEDASKVGPWFVYDPGAIPALNVAIRELKHRLLDELGNKLFLSVPGKYIELFEQKQPLFGVNVEDSFPLASPEIEEAGKCLAVGRWSAAVYHLMRVLEVGLGALAKPLNVSFENRNWGPVINEIESAIRSMSSAKNGPNWKQDEQFYSEAAAHFRILKNAWRNYAMHIHARYDESRATEIFNNVRGFMQVLATKLHQ